MDDIVKQAMAKWPNVPDCYGWLGLDARGNWYMRDDKAQACGTFASGQMGAKGSRLGHLGLISFIERNYQVDEYGQWYFQNGPQRVYVELEVAPWVWRIADDGSVTTHTGKLAQVRKTLVDQVGKVYLDCDLGLGLVHTLDVGTAADAIEQGRWLLCEVQAQELPIQYGFVLSPQANQKQRPKDSGHNET
jgi:hypothetical protein